MYKIFHVKYQCIKCALVCVNGTDPSEMKGSFVD